MPHSSSRPDIHDVISIAALSFLSVDTWYAWDEFNECHRPIQKWLLWSFLFIAVFRFIQVCATLHTAMDVSDFLLSLRHKGILGHLSALHWLMVLPLFALWTVVGTFWIIDSNLASPWCLPLNMQLCFILSWQVVSYAWLVFHALIGARVWLLERRLRIVEMSLQAIEDADMFSRWGRVSQQPGFLSLSSPFGSAGLMPAEINALPSGMAENMEIGDGTVCPICLGDMKPGDSVRQLATCLHTFHVPCIDLWLLRRADCPLCKGGISPLSETKARLAEPQLGLRGGVTPWRAAAQPSR